MPHQRFHRAVVTGALVVASAVAAYAQQGRPKAQLTPVVETANVRAGTTVNATLKVALPANVHVQSDKPRDESLIPTALTIDAPPGITVAEIVYPKPTDLAQTGASEPLEVFGPTFAIGVRLTLAKGVAAGDVVIPAHLNYQACDSHSCFPPARADAQWTLTVK